jgi:hypothetical protein
MSHAALRTILPVAGRDVERARAVEIIGIFFEEEVTHQSSRSQVSKELGIQLHTMLVENGL